MKLLRKQNKMKRVLLFLTTILTLSGCEYNWRMRSTQIETLSYKCSGTPKSTSTIRDWIFVGTKSEAEDKTGTKSYSTYEYPYCITRETTTVLIGKE